MKAEQAGWPDAVVFDLDGTLIDSLGDIARALNWALGQRGIPPFPVEQVKGMVGGGVPKLVERALTARGVSKIAMGPVATDFLSYYSQNPVKETRLYEGARELLEKLKGEGRKLGLCTNKRHELAVEIIERLDLARYFSAVIGERTGKPRKPDPAPLRGVLAALGLPPFRAVMIGDSKADVGCAKGARVQCIVVDFGYSRIPVRELGADAVISKLADAPRCFAALSPKSLSF